MAAATQSEPLPGDLPPPLPAASFPVSTTASNGASLSAPRPIVGSGSAFSKVEPSHGTAPPVPLVSASARTGEYSSTTAGVVTSNFPAIPFDRDTTPVRDPTVGSTKAPSHSSSDQIAFSAPHLHQHHGHQRHHTGSTKNATGHVQIVGATAPSASIVGMTAGPVSSDSRIGSTASSSLPGPVVGNLHPPSGSHDGSVSVSASSTVHTPASPSPQSVSCATTVSCGTASGAVAGFTGVGHAQVPPPTTTDATRGHSKSMQQQNLPVVEAASLRVPESQSQTQVTPVSLATHHQVAPMNPEGVATEFPTNTMMGPSHMDHTVHGAAGAGVMSPAVVPTNGAQPHEVPNGADAYGNHYTVAAVPYVPQDDAAAKYEILNSFLEALANKLTYSMTATSNMHTVGAETVPVSGNHCYNQAHGQSVAVNAYSHHTQPHTGMLPSAHPDAQLQHAVGSEVHEAGMVTQHHQTIQHTSNHETGAPTTGSSPRGIGGAADASEAGGIPPQPQLISQSGDAVSPM